MVLVVLNQSYVPKRLLFYGIIGKESVKHHLQTKKKGFYKDMESGIS